MFLGIDIGGTKCALTLGDKDGNVIKKERFLKKKQLKQQKFQNLL